ncbi:MAG: hypothetical protein KDA61_12865, partial [Planctomycetales bacterium]|nr:hypothetical protein [Planctomycetales bacterium]
MSSLRLRRWACVAALTAFSLVGLSSIGTGQAARSSVPARLTVSNQIVRRDAEPIGANLTTIAGGTNFAVNNHVWNSGFEPAVWRKFVRVERCGRNWFEWDSQGGPAYWNLAWTGLGDGADARIYRIVDKEGAPLAYGGGKDMNDIRGAERVVFVSASRVGVSTASKPAAGYVSNDDRDGDSENNLQRVYLEDDVDLSYGDYVYMALKTTGIAREASPPNLRKHYRGEQPYLKGSSSWRGSLVAHPQPLPPDFAEPGETCLKAELLERGGTTPGQFVYHEFQTQGEGQWYSQLHPGASYRVDVWLRQEGLNKGGRARFR